MVLATLATLEEVVPRAGRSPIKRGGAILRLIYSFEAVWKACQQLLAESEGIEVGSPNGTIRAARRPGWLSDADAQAPIGIGRDRNLAVYMYRGKIGEEIQERLAAHAPPLRRWLAELQRQATPKDPPPV
jgi:hypothetical protein